MIGASVVFDLLGLDFGVYCTVYTGYTAYSEH